MIGKLLKERYQIVQVLSAGAFGRIYIAEDIHQAGNPRCVIKHVKPPSSDIKYLRTTRRRFATEVEVLKRLSHHEQIPALHAGFEENQEFYLVQEFIDGHPLSAELPISSQLQASYLDVCIDSCQENDSFISSHHWTEDQCIELLREVLLILQFVHAQGLIHCDLKPNNIIKRLCDGKLFLIDFGAVQLVRSELGSGLEETNRKPLNSTNKPLIANPLLGYIPIEQLRGYPCPSSDIYALGLIAVQALTGLDPAQLKVDRDTGEVIWQDQVQISERLAFVINTMISYDFKNRYQSAVEALQALSCLTDNSQELGVVRHYLSRIPVEMPSLPIKASELSTQAKFILHLLSLFIPKPSPLRNIVAAGIAANTLVILFGIFSLLYAFGLEPEPDVLSKAQEQYQQGDLEEAIATAKSIPKNNPAYPEAQVAIKEWRHSWNIAAAEFEAVEQAFNEGRLLDVLQEERKLPAISFWRQKVEPFVEQAKSQIEKEAHQLLQKAYDQALLKNFTGALQFLQQIPPNTSISEKVKQKVAEYQKKQDIKAEYLLEQAEQLAEAKNYTGALSLIKQISPETAAYEKAKAKIAEYTQQQRLKQEAEKQEKPSINTSPTASPQPRDFSKIPQAVGRLQDLNPGNQLIEITLKQVAK